MKYLLFIAFSKIPFSMKAINVFHCLSENDRLKGITILRFQTSGWFKFKAVHATRGVSAKIQRLSSLLIAKLKNRRIIKLIQQGVTFCSLNIPLNLKMHEMSNIFREGKELIVRTEKFPYPSSEAASLSCLNLQSGLVQALPYLQARPDDGTTVGFSSGFGGSSNWKKKARALTPRLICAFAFSFVFLFTIWEPRPSYRWEFTASVLLQRCQPSLILRRESGHRESWILD